MIMYVCIVFLGIIVIQVTTGAFGAVVLPSIRLRRPGWQSVGRSYRLFRDSTRSQSRVAHGHIIRHFELMKWIRNPRCTSGNPNLHFFQSDEFWNVVIGLARFLRFLGGPVPVWEAPRVRGLPKLRLFWFRKRGNDFLDHNLVHSLLRDTQLWWAILSPPEVLSHTSRRTL